MGPARQGIAQAVTHELVAEGDGVAFVDLAALVDRPSCRPRSYRLSGLGRLPINLPSTSWPTWWVNSAATSSHFKAGGQVCILKRDFKLAYLGE